MAALRSAEIVLDVEVERGRVHLVLANCGDAVATEIRTEFSRPLVGPETTEVSALPVFRHLGVLRPGCMVRVFWDAAAALLAAGDRAAPFVATVSWRERTGAGHRAEYRHDLSIYRMLPQALTE